jgi:hypothetical protein
MGSDVAKNSIQTFGGFENEGFTMMRKVAASMNCGETRELAANGLCFRCYRQQERADDRQIAKVDRHSGAIRREHKKLLRGFASLMVGLSDLGISSNDLRTIRRIVEPYVEPIKHCLALPTQELQHERPTVNSEVKTRNRSHRGHKTEGEDS